MEEHPHYCWYCINAYRVFKRTIRCNRDNDFHDMTWSCLYWKECPEKKYAPDNALNI